jgi:hypothetical protein
MTTRKQLDRLVTLVSSLQKRPVKVWEKRQDGTLYSNIKALHLDYAACYGGYDLVEIVNERGGERSLVGNTFCGRGRLKAKEMETFLLGMIAVLEAK